MEVEKLRELNGLQSKIQNIKFSLKNLELDSPYFYGVGVETANTIQMLIKADLTTQLRAAELEFSKS